VSPDGVRSGVWAATLAGSWSGMDKAEREREAQRPLTEAGQGESEGFEEAERELIEHATHGDQHAARRVIADASRSDEDGRAVESGAADSEHSSELRDGESEDF
jgi:L-asparaginase II